ncbi:MAG TPA: glycosyltransferase family 39 protein [Candidatus Omnitrophota bacterium]|nr:glycosyltransferase family 39 protein [Candidatus Omnitrophota bacterium]
MVNLIAYLISSAIGFLLIRLILGEKIRIPFFLHGILSIGLGLGVSGILTFFFLLAYGSFHAFGIILVHLVLLATLVVLNVKYLPFTAFLCKETITNNTIGMYIVKTLLWVLASILIGILSQQYPYGGWDAWALYNMKAKFLIEGGQHWTDITRLHWHTQPSYPLLLPLINTWIFALVQKNLVPIASMTGVMFSVSCGLLCYAGLSLFINRPVAFIASLLLLTNPLYIFWSTTQYADVLLAYYLLASMILMVLTLRTLEPRVALLAGLFWGLMPLAKNEGNVFLFFLTLATSITLLWGPRDQRISAKRMILHLLIGILCTSLMNIIFKIFMAPPTREVLFNPLTQNLSYFNLNGILTTVGFYFYTIRSPGWIFIWGLVFILGLINYRKWFALKESRIMGIVFAGFLLVLLYVYISTAHFDLIWRLQCTAIRIAFYLLPSILFFCFYTLWAKNPKN